ncbi:MAG: hypothetical protein LBV40_05710 [Methanomicrobiales archaeon]|jgi:hypothetical protein|nr:hypothetical protein [Methanomicrobiales archaeon]
MKDGLYNIETEKVLTYTSQNGSHLMGEELYVLDVAGNWSSRGSDLICVFARSELDLIPAFCNKVTASSTLRSITTEQIQSIGSATAVGSTPAALNYEIVVTPDGAGYAHGIVSTVFTVSVMEGRIPEMWEEERNPMAGLLAMGYQWVRGTGFGGSWWELYDAGGNQVMGFQRGVSGSDGVIVWYDNVDYSASLATLDGDIVLWENGIVGGKLLPPEVQITVNGGDGSGPFTLTYQGATYTINPWDAQEATAIVMTRPHIIVHLENYDELAATLTTIDTTTVSGGITQFTKEFHYQSGIDCEGC